MDKPFLIKEMEELGPLVMVFIFALVMYILDKPKRKK